MKPIYFRQHKPPTKKYKMPIVKVSDPTPFSDFDAKDTQIHFSIPTIDEVSDSKRFFLSKRPESFGYPSTSSNSTTVTNVFYPYSTGAEIATGSSTLDFSNDIMAAQYQDIVHFYDTKYNFVVDKTTQFKNKIKRQLIEYVSSKFDHRVRATKYSASFKQTDESELTALNLLKMLVDSREWRRYLSYGFIMTQGPSMLRYQIVRKEHHVKVFSLFGKLLAEICVNLKSSFNTPPTDNVIAKKMMIEGDEHNFWKQSNVYPRCMGFSPEKAFTKEIVEARAY